MANKSWLKLATIKRNEKGNQYMAFGNPKDKFQPVSVELVVKDPTGNVIVTLTNPKLTVQNPRKRPGITPEQVEKIPEYLLADVSLPPAKEEGNSSF